MIQVSASGDHIPMLVTHHMCDSVTDISCRLLPTLLGLTWCTSNTMSGKQYVGSGLLSYWLYLLRFYELKVKCLPPNYRQAMGKTTI